MKCQAGAEKSVSVHPDRQLEVRKTKQVDAWTIFGLTRVIAPAERRLEHVPVAHVLVSRHGGNRSPVHGFELSCVVAHEEHGSLREV